LLPPPLLLLLQALCNSGVVFRELERLEEAVAAYEAALAVSCFLTLNNSWGPFYELC
jgi:hypothetical protein